MLRDVLEVLNLAWVGTLIGVLGVAVAVATYVLSRRRKMLAYRTRGIHLIGNADPGLPSDITIQYRGQTVPRVTRSFLVIWNEGEETITRSDIASADPLVVDVGPEAKILRVMPTKITRTVTQVSAHDLPESPNKALIDFDFLDTKDGAVLEILHTGEKRHPRLTGTVRGIPSGPKNYGQILSNTTSKSPRVRRSSKALAIAAIVVGIGFSLMLLTLPDTIRIDSVRLPQWISYLIIALSVMYAILGFALLWLIRRRYPRALHVDELD